MRISTRLLSEHGMLLVLFLLCAFFAVVTWDVQDPQGAGAARQVVEMIGELPGQPRIVVVAKRNPEELEFAETLRERLSGQPEQLVAVISAAPSEVRRTLEDLLRQGKQFDVIACSRATATWGVYQRVGEQYPALADARIIQPRSYYASSFLQTRNLLNIANQIAVTAIIAVGMTMVIITRGIDLSVGSLVALSAVITARLIRDYAGAEEAGTMGMILCSLGAILICGAFGRATGQMVTLFRTAPNIPPFIATLAVMLIASGAAYLISNGQSINAIPASFTWLGRGADLAGIPNAVVLMVLIYVAAHLLMTRTLLGRYIYAVGGNPQAAELSGIAVRRVLAFVYTASGVMAGLGGVMLASQLKAGAPTYGLMYELYVIAAVVVGGTSLAGGEGRMLGTLIGAFIIAVIQNGMNLLGLESHTQKVVLGAVIMLAVALDTAKKHFS
jgi:ribose transport system permease protein